MRPSTVSHEDSTAWKAEALIRAYPKISGIVDDSHSLAQKLEHRYDGTLFLINPIKKPYAGKSVRQFASWREFGESFLDSGMDISE